MGAPFAQRNQLSTLNQARLIYDLWTAGFYVRWERTQHKDPTQPTSSDGGYWWVLGWCVGTPQYPWLGPVVLPPLPEQP